MVPHEPYTVLAGHIGEAARDIRSAGEHHAFDLRANRGQRRTDVVAAIEKG